MQDSPAAPPHPAEEADDSVIGIIGVVLDGSGWARAINNNDSTKQMKMMEERNIMEMESFRFAGDQRLGCCDCYRVTVALQDLLKGRGSQHIWGKEIDLKRIRDKRVPSCKTILPRPRLFQIS